MATVLVIDDHPASRDYVTFVLEHTGHRVLCAEDGARGLELARQERPALIISDILMPTMDGIELARRLHADPDLRSIPLIFYTATYREREAERVAASVGANRVLLKPADPDLLLATVSEVLGTPKPTLEAAGGEAQRRRAHEALLERLARATSALDLTSQRLTLLIDAGRQFTAQRDPHELARELARAARSMVSARYAVVCLRTPSGDEPRVTCAVAGLPLDPAPVLPLALPDRGLLARVLSGNATLRETDLSGPVVAGLPAEHPPVAHLLASRIGPSERPLGLVYAVDKVGGGPFEPEEEVLLATLADQAGTLLEKLRLDRELACELSERRRAQEALEESEERHRMISELTSDFTYSWSLAEDGTMHLTWVSPSFTKLFGYAREEVDGEHWRKLIHPEDLPRAEAELKQVMSGHESTAELRMVSRAGKVHHLRAFSRPLLDGGRVVRFYGAVQDITSQRTLEEQLRQSQKMEAVGRLAGGVAHDFNNMLTVINGYAGMVLERMSAEDPRRADVVEIATAGERASSLTRQLLAFSRRQVLQPRLVEVNAVVAEMDRMLQRLIGENIELVTQLDPAAGLVRVDSAQLEQVLMNLAVNARDAMPSGGKLTLETAPIALDGEYAALHPEVTPGAYAVIAMSDTGHGMDRETQARIFEPFFTTKRKGEGTGLGLSIVYGIIQQSGGHIRVYAEPGRGATFRLYLPREGGPSDERIPEAPREQRAEGHGTVLLVEDEPSVRKLAVKVLRDCGYVVLEADGAQAALETAAKHEGTIDLLVSDVVMPTISGPELLEKVREKRPRLRALFVSGYTESAAMRHGVLRPGTPFLEKPFSPATLTRRVREVLEEVES